MNDVELFESPLSKKRSILALLHYFVGYTYLYPMLLSVLTQAITGKPGLSVEMAFLLCVVVMVTMVILLWPVFKESWDTFKQDITKNIGYVLIYGVLLFIVCVISSLIVMFITGLDTSENQEAIEQMFRYYPIYITFSAVVFAPIVEEGLFRGVLFRGLSSQHIKAAYIVSSLLFGFIHVYDSVFSGNFLDLTYLLVYGGMGWVFASLYHKSDQMISGILLHALYNGLSILSLLML